MLKSLVFGLLLVSSGLGNPAKPLKACRDYTLPFTTNTSNLIWGLSELQNDYDATTFTTDLGRWDANITLNPVSGISPAVVASYKISGTFCSPTTGGNGTVLLATHGLGFDRSYWAPKIQPEKYSFVDFAIARGYSVFLYDRLGVAKSSLISGYVNQVSIQASILAQLVTEVREGKFGKKPKSVVLVGHSFGSVLSNVLLSVAPGIVDAAVLTGIGYAIPSSAVNFEAWQPRLARLQSPGRWRQLDGGYLTWVDKFANVNTFFKFPFYDTKVVEYAEANKQPFALMEIISLSGAKLDAPAFTGPVLVINGEYDFIFCTGYCPGILEPAAKLKFPASKGLEVYEQPGSGHGINLSLNATGAFEFITNFLSKNGF